MEALELMDKKIVFCFPYRGVGGVSLLFLRLGGYLKQRGYQVAIVDYIDGYMASNNHENIELIEYRDCSEVSILDNEMLVMQMMTPWSIYPALNIAPRTKLFFITTLPVNTYPLLPFFRNTMSPGGFLAKLVWNTILRSEFKKAVNFLNIGLNACSVTFLDEDIVGNISNSLDVTCDNYEILPLFSGDVNGNLYLKKKQLSSNRLVLGWVGRISDFKIHILNKVLIDVKKVSESEKLEIKFFIIGVGEEEDSLIDVNGEFLKVERVSHVTPSNLSDTLISFDLLFAMGTSALDGARLGVPVVRLDYSFNIINDDYKYKFLFDVTGYSLGELIGGKSYSKGQSSMSNLVKRLLAENERLSALTYDFYRQNHSLESSGAQFQKLIASANLTWSDLELSGVTHSWLFSLWYKIRNIRF